jgi:hypothetical protein
VPSYTRLLSGPQMKVGEPRECALNAAGLAAKDKPLEARLFGYSVLHHLVSTSPPAAARRP